MASIELEHIEILDLIEGLSLLIRENEKYLRIAPESSFYRVKLESNEKLLGKLLKAKSE